MGVCQSKKASASVSASRGGSPSKGRRTFEDELNDSLHGKHRTTRQKLARHYEDMHISEAYNIQSLLGQGSMGEVRLVEKKDVVRPMNHNKDDHLSASVRHCSFDLFPDDLSPGRRKRKYACKTVNTLRMNTSELREFLNETDILRDLDHPNIVQLFEVYRQKRKIWIVMELCLGGDLFTRADTNNEEDVVILLEQITRAVAYMHKRNVCHRDIKMENVLYLDNSPTSPVKLIDFGISNNFKTNEGLSKMSNACGTIYTAAPELLLRTGFCTEQTDIWSIGVVAFVLLSQQYPFLKEPHELQDETKLHNLENAKFTFDEEWDKRNVTPIAKGFVSKCLQKNQFNRCSALDSLDYVQTQWIPHLERVYTEEPTTEDINTSQPNKNRKYSNDSDCNTSTTDSETSNNDTPSSPPKSVRKQQISEFPLPLKDTPLRQSTSSSKKRLSVSSSMLQGMSKFGKYGDFKKTVLRTISYDMDKSSLRELGELFIVLNTSQDGTITLLDLKHALKAMDTGKDLDNYRIEEIFKGVDVDNTGQIHYNEFLAAVVESQGLITPEHFAEAFNRIDIEGKGYISKNDLEVLLGKECDNMTVTRMMKEAKLNPNGKISYEQFLNVMTHDPSNNYGNIEK